MPPEESFPDIDNVRPVNPRFFGAVLRDEGISSSAKESLVNNALEGRVKLESIRSQLVQSQQQERLGQLRIEREEFMLSRAREKAQQDKTAVVKAGELAGTFTALLDDPDLSPEQKRGAMARLRLQNPEAFSRSDTLRDQFKTLDSVLPQPKKPLSISEQLAIQNFQRSLSKDQQLEYRRTQEDQKDLADRTFDAYDDTFERIRGARFKKPSDSFEDDAKFTDEFEKPEDLETTIGFLETYAPFVGVELPGADILKNMGANELRRRAGEVDRLLRPQLLRERKALAPGTPRVSGLNIPDRL